MVSLLIGIFWPFALAGLVLALLAHLVCWASWSRCCRLAARLSGYKAARQLLDAAGLGDVEIQQAPGFWSDHYDTASRSLRLSESVYHGRSLAAVAVASHEAAHAIQQAAGSWSLFVRPVGTAAASFGTSAAIILLLLGAAIAFAPLVLAGAAILVAVVAVQLVNLPMEFDASCRAGEKLLELGVVSSHELPELRWMLRAAALSELAMTWRGVLVPLQLLGRLVCPARR